MLQVKRYPSNPILSAEPAHEWESYAVFNGCVIKDNGIFHMTYRAMSKEKKSTIGIATSPNGINFSDRRLFIEPVEEWEKYGCEDPRITKFEDKYYIFYTAISAQSPSPSDIKVAVAISDDLKTIKERHLVTPFNAKAMTLFPKRINGKITAILTVNTDLPPDHIAVAQFDNLKEMWSEEYWQKWYQRLDHNCLHLKRLSSDQIEVGAPPVETEYGWILTYSYISNYAFSKPSFAIEIALVDHDVQKIIGKINEPVLTPREIYELSGQVNNVVFPSGALIENDNFYIYYGAADTSCCLATCNLKNLLSNLEMTRAQIIKLNRFEENPILEPITSHSWESKAVFNAGVIREEGQTYILYRAMSEENISTIGCAISRDGYHIDERLTDPIYVPREDFEKKHSGYNSGCEDPRLTRIDDKIYMFYTAYDGINSPRVAIASISLEDFLKRKWNWSWPKLISPPGIDDKDACIFPEKVNGKYVILHRIEPDIVIDYVDDLEFKENDWLQIKSVITPRKGWWDSYKIGATSPAIKTKYGWLLLYHGINVSDNEYRIGAMLLEEKDPSNVLARTEHPLFEPEKTYEKKGIVNNVVFPCGTAIIDNNFFVYYGAADRLLCLATIDFETIVENLKSNVIKKYLI